MAQNLFQQLEIEAFRAGITPRTKQSIEWFRNKARQLGKTSIANIMDEPELELQSKAETDVAGPLGQMYMFQYDPKYRTTLPYYDAFPLVIITGARKGGFIGMNLHYLPPPLRAKLLDSILGNTASVGLPRQYVEPTIHRYLNNHVRSRFAKVDKPEWEIATFLPTAQWRKAPASTVYKDTRRAVRRLS